MAVSGMRGCGALQGKKIGLYQGELEDHSKRLPPFGNHTGCRTAQNGKLEDWVSGPSAPEPLKGPLSDPCCLLVTCVRYQPTLASRTAIAAPKEHDAATPDWRV